MSDRSCFCVKCFEINFVISLQCSASVAESANYHPQQNQASLSVKCNRVKAMEPASICWLDWDVTDRRAAFSDWLEAVSRRETGETRDLESGIKNLILKGAH